MTSGCSDGQLDIEVSLLARTRLSKSLPIARQRDNEATQSSECTCPYRSVNPDPSSTSINIESLPYRSSRYFPSAKAPYHRSPDQHDGNARAGRGKLTTLPPHSSSNPYARTTVRVGLNPPSMRSSIADLRSRLSGW